MNKTARKVAIIGTGFVGSSIAYAIVNQGICNELVLIDVNQNKAEGEALDLADGIAWADTKTTIYAGDYADCKDAALVILTAGINQKPGQSRLDLVDTNAKITEQVTTEIMASGFDGIIIVASNPVDVMTYIAWQASGLPFNRVIGTGTMLDTARFKKEIALKLNVDPRIVQGYIIGEHGDSETAVWSHTTVGGKPIIEWDNITADDLNTIYVSVRDAAYEIIDRKQATYYGIGMSTARLVRAILNNENTILPVSAFQRGEYGEIGLFTGTPALINETGLRQIIALNLTAVEQVNFETSVNQLRLTIQSLDSK